MSKHFGFNTLEMGGSFWTVILLHNLDGNRPGTGRRHLDLDPATLNPIIEQEPNQLGHTHVPHGCSGSDEKSEEVLFAESDVPDDHGKFNSGKEEYDSQNRTWKDLEQARL